MAQPKVLVLGHSYIRRLETFLYKAGEALKHSTNFTDNIENLGLSSCEVRFLGICGLRVDQMRNNILGRIYEGCFSCVLLVGD
jgi:hypothetical protein